MKPEIADLLPGLFMQLLMKGGAIEICSQAHVSPNCIQGQDVAVRASRLQPDENEQFNAA
eukprot:scaffold582_cov385-Prasinococcus_capsulatus_cf.AAC.31